MSATAAKGSFPYPHRTVEEAWREQDAAKQAWDGAVANAILSHKGPGARNDRLAGLSYDRGSRSVPKVSQFPDSSCPLCGARGWCGHIGRIAA